ncbi:MAG: hypothetical protein R6U31_02700 [bacterium]
MNKKYLIIIMVVLLTAAGCYMIPGKMVSVPDLTISIPLGDTTVTVAQAALEDTQHISIIGDTVFAQTKTRSRTDIPSIPAGSLRISIDIEELIPEDIIDTTSDSTSFTSTIDRISNFVTIYGEFSDTASGRIHHLVTNRRNDTIYNSTVSIEIPSGSYDSTAPFEEILTINDFPFGDYRHDIDIVVDSADYTMRRAESYSRMALSFDLAGDQVVILARKQGLISPPDSTALDLINSVEINLDVTNRMPFRADLIVNLYNGSIDSLEDLQDTLELLSNPVLTSTFSIPCAPIDPTGRTLNKDTFHYEIKLDETLRELFVYDKMYYKARLEIPPYTDENGDTIVNSFVLPTDYMTLGGYIVVNFDLDDNKLSDENKIFGGEE